MSFISYADTVGQSAQGGHSESEPNWVLQSKHGLTTSMSCVLTSRFKDSLCSSCSLQHASNGIRQKGLDCEETHHSNTYQAYLCQT